MLDEIGIRTGTDKSSRHHDYLNRYEEFLNPDTIGCLLEIGVLYGRSMLMWREWLPNAVIVGVDKWGVGGAFVPIEVPGVNIESADATDRKQMGDLAARYAPFDVIIDDGSHLENDQLQSFQILWPYLNFGGYYIIEDIPKDCNRFPGATYVDGKQNEKFAYFQKALNEGTGT